MIRVIVFDFDGVLVESVDIKTQAYSNLFKRYGEEIEKLVIDYHLRNGGMSRFEKIKYYYDVLLKEQISERELENLCIMFSQMVVDAVIASPWVPGADVFIENNFNIFDLFIFSGTPEDELKTIVSRRNMSTYFKNVLGAPVKKNIILRSILENYNYKSEEVLVIGDSITDYEAAIENGVYFWGRVPFGNDSPFPMGTITFSDFYKVKPIIHKFIPEPFLLRGL